MKTMKVLFSIAGVVLTSFCFGQLLSQNDEPVLHYSASYDATNNRLVHHVNEVPEQIASWDQYERPHLSRSYYVALESKLVLEPWMTRPFVSPIIEEELELESWMTSPFKNPFIEEDIPLESWMTRSWI